jgi:CRP/FNR family transcriptional regulator
MAVSDNPASAGDFATIERFVSEDTFLSKHAGLSRDLAAAARLRTLEDGHLAGAAGEEERSVTGLVEGNLVVWLPIQDGSLRPLHVVRPGAWLVSFPLIKGEPRRVTFSASGRARILYVDQDAVDRVVAAHPVIWRWFTCLAAEHLDRALAVCVGLLADRPLPRVAGRLMALSSDTVGPNVAIDLKQSDLALLSGLSRNTVSRTLGQLEAMGLIARGYRRLRILDRTGLARVAAGEMPGHGQA